ncbi:hypothetical protein CJ030_MR5G009949 [Morella rubra]|uniref:RNA-dependent RNA polymerase n=1 Tax=Morella rubra TaxID=262757 RepID=A0A6A1VPZ9_9ROSI|nr:hypothetical protein CJ030_MR5G009949 [Morella rubra]
MEARLSPCGEGTFCFDMKEFISWLGFKGEKTGVPTPYFLLPRGGSLIYEMRFKQSQIDCYSHSKDRMKTVGKNLCVINQGVPGRMSSVPIWKALPTRLRNLSTNRRGPKALAKARSCFPSLAFEVDSFSYMIQVMCTSGYPVTQGLLWPERIRRTVSSSLKELSAEQKPRRMGRLGQVVEGGGKSLLFAIGNYVNQRLLHPFHVWVAEVHPGVRFTSYAVLGDDVVIADQEVAKVYESALGGLGITISYQKSLIGSAEFAKCFRVRELRKDLSPISIRSF